MRLLCVAISVCFAVVLSGGSCCTTDDDILIDIIFVVDGSGSIGSKNFDLVKTWLINATSTMSQRFGQRAQFCVLEYSNKDPAYKRIPIEKSTVFEIPFRLGDCDTVRCMTTRIENMDYLQSQTYTYYALRRAIEVEFPYSSHWSRSKKAIILLTDGTANDGTFLPRAYEECVRKNITGFAIGVGNYRVDQLRTFANGGDTNERVFTRTNFNSLISVISSLETELENADFFCDECKSGTDDCSFYAKCINVPDGFNCICQEGYYGDGKNCKAIDYCNPNPCREISNTRCAVESMKPKCVCLDGYRQVGESCEEIDECADNPCRRENSKCVDFVGGFVCGCEDGYVKDGENCVEPEESPSDMVTIITTAIALVILTIIIVVAVYSVRRQHTYTIASGKGEELLELGKPDEYLMQEQEPHASPEA